MCLSGEGNVADLSFVPRLASHNMNITTENNLRAKSEFEKQKKKEIVDLQQAYSKDAARQIEDLYKQIEVSSLSSLSICH